MAFEQVSDEQLDTSKFETPEELCLKLEAKSKVVLAEKVRTVISAIEWSSQQKWEALKAELSEVEEKEIRDTFESDGTDISHKLDEWLSEEARWANHIRNSLAWTAAASILGWQEETISKWLSYFEKLEKSWDKASEHFWDWEYLKAFLVFLWWLIGNYKEWEEETDESSESSNSSVETNETIKVDSTINVFIWIAKEWKNNELNDIISSKSFKRLKYSEVIELSELSKSELKVKLDKEKQLDTNIYNIDEIYDSIKILTKWKWKNIIKEIYKDKSIEALTIKEIFLWLSDELVILNDINNIDLDNILEVWSTFDFKQDSEWNIGWALKSKFESLKISTDIISLWINKDLKFDNQNILTNEIKKETSLDSNDQKQALKIIDFWFKIQEMIKSNDNLNLGNINLEKILSEKPLNFWEVLKLYAISWWNHDFNTMNAFQKTYIYLNISSILDKRKEFSKDWEYITAMLWEIVKSWQNQSSKIPDDVILILWDISKSIWNKAVKISSKYLEKIWWALKENPMIWVVIILITIIYPFTQRKSILWKLLWK